MLDHRESTFVNHGTPWHVRDGMKTVVYVQCRNLRLAEENIEKYHHHESPRIHKSDKSSNDKAIPTLMLIIHQRVCRIRK
jgi:hypothetical protein